MKNLLIGLSLLICVCSCKNDEISFSQASQELRFSKDTVKCDTVYNQIRSETYAVKVYNDEEKDIIIPKIELESGANSLYKINVDGKAGYTFHNVPLRKKDSLYVFVEIAPQTTRTEHLALDKILFHTRENKSQFVQLYSVVQDAEFFIQSDTNNNVLDGNHTWRNNKAKVIFGDLTIAPNSSLTIERGTKVIFAQNSGMKVSQGGGLFIQGDVDHEVIFRGDRQDPRYDTIPKHWKGIYTVEGASLNINYAKIFGGNTGIDAYKSLLNIRNTMVYAFQEYGIRSIASTLKAENLVTNHCGISCIGIFQGGNVDVIHSTLANYWAYGGLVPAYSLYVSNEWKNASGSIEFGALYLSLKNSIVYGEKENAIYFAPTTGQIFSYNIDASLFKYGNNTGFPWDNNSRITNSMKNQSPLFANTSMGKMNLRLGGNSPARGKGNPNTALLVPMDIKKINRGNAPNMGAYE